MKKCLFLLCAFLGLVGRVGADVIEGKCGDGVIYQWDTETGKLVISGHGPMDDYKSIDERPWHGPSPSLFKSIVIEHGVTHIGDRAFWGFYGFDHLTLPMSVTSIGDEAFYACNYLTTLVMSPSVVSIGNQAFASCSGLDCELVLSDCLETIGEGAFSGCKKLKGDLLIPNSVKTIGNNAFAGCVGFTGALYLGTSLETIGEHAFSGGLNFTGNLAIPETVTSIGRSAFDGCKYLVGEVVVPKGVTTIEDCVFRDCSGITGITLLGEVTHIRNSAFSRCSSLIDFVCHAITPPDATEYFVFDKIPLNTVYVPAESVDLYKAALVWKDFEILPIGGSGMESTLNGNSVCISLRNGKLMVKTENGHLKSVALVSVNGVEVLSDKIVSSFVELDMSSVPSGIYLVSVVTNTGECCRKVVW